MQDATLITLWKEWSGYAGVLAENIERIDSAPKGVFRLALGGTAVGTGINAAPGFAEAAAAEIAPYTGIDFPLSLRPPRRPRCGPSEDGRET
jgi:fumarate hydratase, class II